MGRVVDRARQQQRRDAEVVAEPAIAELDEARGRLLAIGTDRGLRGPLQHRRIRVVAHAQERSRQRRSAGLRIRPQYDGVEDDRNRHRCRDRLGDVVAREVAADERERERREDEGDAVVEVGRLDPDVRLRTPEHVGEGRAVEDLGVEREREVVVEAAAEDAQEVRGQERQHVHAALEIAREHVVAEAGEALAAVKAVIGGGERASRDAADEGDVVEQVAVIGHRLRERQQHAVREGRRAHPAAGE